MRVLQVIDRMMRGGGAEKFVLELSLALNKIKNIHVDVLSISTPQNSDYVDILREDGISHTVLSENLYSYKSIGRLKNIIKDQKYDVVHVHLFPALYIASISKQLYNLHIRLIYTEHSTHNRRRDSSFFRLIDRRIYKAYDQVIGISDKVKSNLDLHLGSNYVKIINNGVDLNAIEKTQSISLRREIGINDDAVIVTMVSRITEGKDFVTVIKAIELLPSKFHVVFVGDGPLMDTLLRNKEYSSAKDRIHILGMRKDVFAINKSSDIIVLSTHHEGFSIAMLEAMASRKPFVASSVEGIKDLVSDIAVLFDYGNFKQLSSVLMKLDSDREYYEAVVTRCYEFARNYDINNVANQYLKSYSE